MISVSFLSFSVYQYVICNNCYHLKTMLHSFFGTLLVLRGSHSHLYLRVGPQKVVSQLEHSLRLMCIKDIIHGRHLKVTLFDCCIKIVQIQADSDLCFVSFPSGHEITNPLLCSVYFSNPPFFSIAFSFSSTAFFGKWNSSWPILYYRTIHWSYSPTRH